MFTTAYEISSKFTYPLIVCIRFHDKTIECGLGAFVVLNDEGWIVTAAHNLGVAFAFEQHQKEMKEFNEKVEKINASNNISPHKRKAIAKGIKPNNKWVTDFVIMLGGQNIPILEHYIYGDHDIAFLRIDKNNMKNQTIFPKLIDPKKIKSGTSLMKLGYPFINFQATFNPTTNSFELPSNLLPVPFFPNEGIYTRNLFDGRSQDGTMDVVFLETSSPGFKGQSGGPICDTQGNLYAIQSQNFTRDLGFKGMVIINKKKVEENQFVNIGVGVHPSTIIALLDKHKIKYDIAS